MFRGKRDLGFPECNWSDANKKVLTGFGWESTNTHTSVQVIFTTNNAISSHNHCHQVFLSSLRCFGVF